MTWYVLINRLLLGSKKIGHEWEMMEVNDALTFERINHGFGCFSP